MSQEQNSGNMLNIAVQEVEVEVEGKKIKGWAALDSAGKPILPKNGKPSPMKADAIEFMTKKIVSALIRRGLAFIGQPTTAEDAKMGENLAQATMLGKLVVQIARVDDKVREGDAKQLTTDKPDKWFDLATNAEYIDKALQLIKQAYMDRAEFIRLCAKSDMVGQNGISTKKIANTVTGKLLPIPKGVIQQIGINELMGGLV